MTRVLALDVGTSSVRAQVYDECGEPVDDGARRKYSGEDDPAKLVAHAREALDEVLGKETVEAVGGSCFGHSLLALGADGKPLTPVLGWRDTRSAEAADWLARTIDATGVHARTGCPIHPSFWPAKLAWLAEAEPETFRDAARFVSFADHLYEQVLGEAPPTSLSLASSTGLLDLHAQTWDEELLGVLGIDPERLPRIDGDAELGDGPVWYPALLDGACSNIGVGCVERTRAALMIGTSGAFRTVYETAVPQPRPGLFVYRLDESRVVEGGALSDGGNLYAWLDDTLQDADESLAERDPDAHGLTFLTLLGGERSPGWHADARGAVAGLTFDTTPRDLRQAALEGVGFRFAEVAELMPEVEDVVATGGALAKSADWCQILADALARPIELSPVDEASARGAAVVTLERLGADPETPAKGRVFEPRADRADEYRAARERQRALYRALV